MEISCNTCHRNGRDNPRFFIPALSETPGTLDVTNGFFSEVREDGVFNPVRLPGLLDVRDKTMYGTRVRKTSLEDFVHGVIVDEFAGPEPAPRVMEALLAYLRVLDSNACPAQDTMPRTLQTDLAFITRTAATLESAIDRREDSVMTLLVPALRTRLQDIWLRYQGQDELRTALEKASRELGRFTGVDAGSRHSFLRQWLDDFNALRPRLEAGNARSLYKL